jgi:transposase
VRAGQIEAVSMDMGPAFAKSVCTHAPQAVIAIDPFHAVKAVTDALDTVRRAVWQQMRVTDPAAAHKFKGARWALLKRPDHLTEDQAGTLRKLRRRGGELWRPYTLREAFRAIFAGDLTIQDVAELLDWFFRTTKIADVPGVEREGRASSSAERSAPSNEPSPCPSTTINQRLNQGRCRDPFPSLLTRLARTSDTLG